ncbi:hypothetical protein [Methyloceanibacter sp.]|uniref:hypothetical protein n=1 Tax=Methyloceanibacter sp. TaxID=1965321 RepID=UPI002D113112|nr:hypothetical protein [Methyloceanibacter sp.]HML90811.1 hypothetical protein [Methyloceanibacter sp.]
MIFQTDPYVMLMASLPAVGPLLTGKAPPINRVRLDERLRQLSAEDAKELDAMAAILSWGRLDIGDEDAAFVTRAERLMETVHAPDLRAALNDRLELRTVIAALRRRHAGQEAPAEGEVWGYGRYAEQIRRNWALPDFGLARTFPWINPARERLEAGDPAGLERIVLQAAWDSVGRYAPGHEFDKEAVAFYVARWSLADRWSSYDPETAAIRFAELIDEAYANAELPEAA